MTRYIDADDFNNNFRGELCENIDCENCSFHIPSYYCKLANYLNNYETSDVKPVVHAQWYETKERTWCSHCREEALFVPSDTWGTDEIYYMSDYCPHCGAVMDEVEK